MDDATRHHINILKEHVKGDLAKNMCIQLLLKEYVAAHPLHPDDDMDLNPHLTIKHYCEAVASQIVGEGFECSSGDVMLMWLTVNIYGPIMAV
jgi:hypothetical protein